MTGATRPVISNILAVTLVQFVTDNVGRGPGKELPEREQASVVKGILISVVNVLALSDVKLDKDE